MAEFTNKEQMNQEKSSPGSHGPTQCSVLSGLMTDCSYQEPLYSFGWETKSDLKAIFVDSVRNRDSCIRMEGIYFQ